MRATLKDVALRANVSIKTVSNVIRDQNSHVSSATRRRVMAAIAELEYRPNVAARQLRRSQVGIVALAIPSLSNPYFADIAAATVQAAAAVGYTVLIDHTSGSRDNETLVVRGLRPSLIDGIIFNPLALNEEDVRANGVDFPIVLHGERLLYAPFDHVLLDNVAAARCATSHLLAAGRRRVAMIGVPDDPADVMPQLRLQGYREALVAADCPVDPQLIAPVPARSFTRTDGAEAMRQLLSLADPPDAVFCVNDLVALGTMRVLHEHGCRIPADVAIVGIDDIEDGRYATPSLTTIAPDKDYLARLTVQLLVDRIQGRRSDPPERFFIPFQLITREST